MLHNKLHDENKNNVVVGSVGYTLPVSVKIVLKIRRLMLYTLLFKVLNYARYLEFELRLRLRSPLRSENNAFQQPKIRIKKTTLGFELRLR